MSITIDGIEYYGVIYKVENVVNHKVYIGQTSNSRGFNGRYIGDGIGAERLYNYLLHKRNNGAYYNQYLLRSIEKYGIDAFAVDEVYDTAISQEELNDKEIYYISKFDSYANGYNLTCGGGGVLGRRSSDCKNSKRICQISTDGILLNVWNCATDVYRELGIDQSSISMVCSGRRKTAGGFVWVHESEYDPRENYKRTPQIMDRGKGTNPVLLIDSNGAILREFYSINEASRQLKDICVEGVRKTCQHAYTNPRYNLIYKREYMGEQRLSVEGHYDIAS